MAILAGDSDDTFVKQLHHHFWTDARYKMRTSAVDDGATLGARRASSVCK